MDFFLLTETWIRPGENSAFSSLLPPGYSHLNTPWESSHGGGLASVYKQNFRCCLLRSKNYSSFKLQLFLIHPACLFCVLLSIIHFIPEFSELLSELLPKYENLLTTGDFNIHVCCPSSPMVNEFQSLSASLDVTQVVNSPTHNRGHMLDLIISYRFSVTVIEICDPCISDHFAVI